MNNRLSKSEEQSNKNRLLTKKFNVISDIKTQVVDTINHYKDIRDIFTLTLDFIMEKLHISEDGNCNRNLLTN